MYAHHWIRTGTVSLKPYPFNSLFNRLHPQIFNCGKALNLEMVTQSGSSSKRPVCPTCSKPSRTCLCTRFKTPKIQNNIAIIILQHSLEQKHPLNSTRIAALGLKNVEIVTVSDVNLQAKFMIRVLDPGHETALSHSDTNCSDICEFRESILRNGCDKDCNSLGFEKYQDEKTESFVEIGGKLSKISDSEIEKVDENRMVNDGSRSNLNADSHSKAPLVDNEVTKSCFDTNIAASRGSEEADIAFTIEKYGVLNSLHHPWMMPGQQQELGIDKLMGCREAVDDLAKGFAVKKLHRKQLNQSSEYDECEEFEAIIPPGSVLLFPSESAVGIEDIDFEVENLIVLDGTWAKAKRMYSENPWLKVLPHLKLDVDKLSLYSEVRHQPRAGYLSTIESIVYALKALGDKSEGLDGLLDVFESMVGDQRQCKNERLSKEQSNLKSN